MLFSKCRQMYYNNSIDDFKVEYPPYLKWGGKYININTPAIENVYNNTNNPFC